jgi:hypothetical protein
VIALPGRPLVFAMSVGEIGTLLLNIALPR